MNAAATDIRLYDERDHAWIARVVDHVVSAEGQPWRVLRERLDHSPIGANRTTAILGALRRILGGRSDRTRIARKVRGLVLGHAALDPATRHARLAAAGDQLGMPAETVAELLWIDLANERPVTLPRGRPAEADLAAFANLERIQRAVRRARSLHLRIPGDAHALVRMAARCGLIATIARDGDATVLDLAGPLSLFHDTRVYGRALAALVPLLADHPGWELVLDSDLGDTSGTFRIAPPAHLPPAALARISPSAAERLARLLLAAAVPNDLDPPPLTHGPALLYPDLAVAHGGRRWLVELVGFATADYLAAKLARYRAAGASDIALLIERKRAPADAVDPRIVTYAGTITAEPLLRFLENPP